MRSHNFLTTKSILMRWTPLRRYLTIGHEKFSSLVSVQMNMDPILRLIRCPFHPKHVIIPTETVLPIERGIETFENDAHQDVERFHGMGGKYKSQFRIRIIFISGFVK